MHQTAQLLMGYLLFYGFICQGNDLFVFSHCYILCIAYFNNIIMQLTRFIWKRLQYNERSVLVLRVTVA